MQIRKISATAPAWLSILHAFFNLCFAAQQQTHTVLFTLERSTNSNQITYEWVSHSNGLENGEIHAYWKMLQTDGHLEELTALEQSRVYGATLTDQSKKEAKITLKAFQDHPIIIRKLNSDDQPKAFLKISNQEIVLSNIYVHLEGWLYPRVKSIDFFGSSALDHSPLIVNLAGLIK